MFKRTKSCVFVALLSIASQLKAAPVEIVPNYLDSIGIGVNDTRPLTLPDGSQTTVGAFRKKTIEQTIRAVSLQFNNSIPFRWNVSFKNNPGYDALTRGPIFTSISREENLDPFGFASVGDSFPVTLLSALRGVDRHQGEHASTQFADYSENFMERIVSTSNQSELTSVVYHELIHVYGFSEPSCLGSCYPARMSKNSHISPILWYRTDSNELVNFEQLDLDGREKAGKSGNRFIAGGDKLAPHTSKAVREELTGGVWINSTGGYVQMFAEPTTNGDWDGQAGKHLSNDVQPAQLMYSSAARTQDMGMAAFILCDIGWCRKQGQVIDLKANASLDENKSTATNKVIKVEFTNLVNYPVDKIQSQLRLQSKLEFANMRGDTVGCTIHDNLINCEFELRELSNKVLYLDIGNISDKGYSIAGEIYSSDFDVDRNGFNNILDATITSKPEGNGGDIGGGKPNENPQKEEKGGASGGSLHIFGLIALSLLALRRKKE